MTLLLLGLFLASTSNVLSVQTGWRPIPGPGPTLGPSLGPTLGPTIGPSHSPRELSLDFPSHYSNHPHMCTLYKATFDQDTFQQYVQFKTQIPDLKEFTLCLWHKFYNHTTDQPLFSYAHKDKARGIYSWVANTDSASFYSMAINGQTIYRLNYPVRLHKWYHLCQSWNGKTGEWQIWVNAERIGRGFHNLLVGKPIKGGGNVITGQEQQQQPKYGSLSRKPAGLMGEITLLVLYKAALTAGKAYTNHKHHHVHHFHHEDKAGEDDYDIYVPPSQATSPPSPAPTAPQSPPMPMHPFLSNGQLQHMLPVAELSAFRGPGGSNNINLFSPYNSQIDILIPGMQRLFKRDQTKQTGDAGQQIKNSEESESTGSEVDDILRVIPKQSKKVKREAESMMSVKEEDVLKESSLKSTEVKKRQTSESTETGEEKNHKKRTLFQEQFQYGLIPGDDLSGLYSGDGYILGGGGIQFNGADSSHPEKAETVQMEPAEWEVRSIMAVCSGCSEDPFRKATLISWRESPKKVFAGASYIPANPECQRF